MKLLALRAVAKFAEYYFFKNTKAATEDEWYYLWTECRWNWPRDGKNQFEWRWGDFDWTLDTQPYCKYENYAEETAG